MVSLAGCDADSARTVRKGVEQAVFDAGIPDDAHQSAAGTSLENIAKSSSTSPAAKSQAAAMLAQQRVNVANELIQKIDLAELKLGAVASQVDQLTVQLDSGNTLVTDYSKYDPAPARSQILAQIAEAQGTPEKLTWFTNNGVTIPTLSVVKQTISQQQSDLAKLEDEAKSLGDQRKVLLTEADAAAQSADSTKGDQSVNEFKRASDLKKKAAGLYTQLDQTKAKMVPIQHDLEVAQTQQGVLEDVVKQLNSQLSELDRGWKSIREQLDAQQALARQIVGSSGETAATSMASPASPATTPAVDGAPSVESGLTDSGATIAAKAATILKMATDIDKMRGEAQSNLDDAAKYYNDATKAAAELSGDLGQKMSAPANVNRPERLVWENLRSAIDPAAYKVREAAAQRMLGALYLSAATSLNNRINLAASVSPVIERAGASTPAELRPDDLAKNATQALNLAEAAYKNSDELLGLVIDGQTFDKSTRESAIVERVLTLYGASQVAKLNANPKEAKAFLESAIQNRNEAAEANTYIPPLPAEMGTPPKAAALSTAPATEAALPATEPTTMPSEPATAPA